MSNLKSVPCFEITRKNVDTIWPKIMQALHNCHYAALDFEFSGIGSRNHMKIGDIEERYKTLADTAKSRAIVSVGVSFFRYIRIENEKLNEMTFAVSNYNLLVSCCEEYVKEDEAVDFLKSHGFNFDLQTSEGLLFSKGNDKSQLSLTDLSLRSLFAEIIKHKIPIVLHNGFIDLVFMYQNFYCQLPSSLQVFLCDLKEMFPNGIYDTKYIAEFEDRRSSTFLEYIFYEKQYRNLVREMESSKVVRIQFEETREDTSPHVKVQNLSINLFKKTSGDVAVCKHYSEYGWCKKGIDCPNSHDIHVIIARKQKKKAKKALAKLRETQESETSINSCEQTETKDENLNPSAEPAIEKNGLHDSGFDAFMTGYCFAASIAVNGAVIDDSAKFTPSKIGLLRCAFNIYLTGKDQPLKVTASSYSKVSANHKTKIANIRSVDCKLSNCC